MTPADPQQTKFVLDESRIPRSWYNIAADLPVAPSPPLHPGTRPADRPGRPRTAVPDGPHRPGGLDRARDRDPGAGPRRVPPVPAEPAVSGASTRAGARYPGAHLLQVRGRQPGGQPQAEYGHPAGVLQPAGRARSGWPPRPAPASGGVPSPSPEPCSDSRSRSTWSRRATTRSRIAGSSWRRTAPRWSRARR